MGAVGKRELDGPRGFLDAMRPGAQFLHLVSCLAPIIWLFVHFSSKPPEAFLSAWFLDPNFFGGFAFASIGIIWLSIVSLLILGRISRTSHLVLRPGCDRTAFQKGGNEAFILFAVFTCLAGLLWAFPAA